MIVGFKTGYRVRRKGRRQETDRTKRRRLLRCRQAAASNHVMNATTPFRRPGTCSVKRQRRMVVAPREISAAGVSGHKVPHTRRDLASPARAIADPVMANAPLLPMGLPGGGKAGAKR